MIGFSSFYSDGEVDPDCWSVDTISLYKGGAAAPPSMQSLAGNLNLLKRYQSQEQHKMVPHTHITAGLSKDRHPVG